MSQLLAKASTRICGACGDLEPVDDGHIEAQLREVSAFADKGCESCALLRKAIYDCVPEAVVSDADAEFRTYVVVRKAILREFIEVVVRFGHPSKTVVLDVFVSPSMSQVIEMMALITLTMI